MGVWQSHFWQIVVRVEADNGTVGYGYGGGGEPACLVVNRHFRELAVGCEIETSEDIRALWDRIYALSLPYGRTGLPVMALSGLDLALWDLLGKVQGRPVYDLLGGLRKPKVRAYATGEAFERYPRPGVHGREVLAPRDRRRRPASSRRRRWPARRDRSSAATHWS